MIWLLLYFTPIGLAVLFLLYAFARFVHRRTGWALPEEVVTFIGYPCDVVNAYTWFRVFGPWPWSFPGLDGSALWKRRTVTALLTAKANGGNRVARGICLALNWLDPGHCDLTR